MKKQSLWIALTLCLALAGCGGKEPAEAENKTLTLATFRGESSSLVQWVNQYNEKHPDITIETVNYQEIYPDPYEAINQIKIEVSAGKGPDLIDFGSLYSPLDASCGMMADLYPLMQADETFDEQDYTMNIMKAFAVGDSLYALVPSYTIDTYATVNEELAGLSRMDIWQLVDAYDKLDEESILFPGETKLAVFGMICSGSLGNYIDWAAGTCDFDSDSFKELLLFANRFPLNLNIDNDYSAKTFFAEGHALLYPVSIDSVYGPANVRMLCGKTPTYIGYPYDEGCGSLAEIAGFAVGISASSPYKEEAWGFLRSLLDSEYQDNIRRGLPVRVSSLEQRLEAAMSAEYDANGEKVVKDSVRFEGEEPINIYEISAEDAETLRALIRSIEYNATADSDLRGILLEEAAYLFNEGRDVDDVANIIQNRASVYISEKK